MKFDFNMSDAIIYSDLANTHKKLDISGQVSCEKKWKSDPSVP